MLTTFLKNFFKKVQLKREEFERFSFNFFLGAGFFSLTKYQFCRPKNNKYDNPKVPVVSATINTTPPKWVINPTSNYVDTLLLPNSVFLHPISPTTPENNEDDAASSNLQFANE